jgi:hypothetical protein
MFSPEFTTVFSIARASDPELFLLTVQHRLERGNRVEHKPVFAVDRHLENARQ